MALFSKSREVEPVEVAGKELVCPICGGRDFWQRETQLNTSGMTLLGLEWANASATNYVCDYCGYMFWFHPKR